VILPTQRIHQYGSIVDQFSFLANFPLLFPYFIIFPDLIASQGNQSCIFNAILHDLHIICL